MSFAIFCHDSQYLAPTAVINHYSTPLLNKIFSSYFLVFWKCGVTPSFISWFINVKESSLSFFFRMFKAIEWIAKVLMEQITLTRIFKNYLIWFDYLILNSFKKIPNSQRLAFSLIRRRFNVVIDIFSFLILFCLFVFCFLKFSNLCKFRLRTVTVLYRTTLAKFQKN